MVDMIEIALGIVAFTLIVNMMIFVILFARTRLVSTGDVTVETVSYTHLTLPTI